MDQQKTYSPAALAVIKKRQERENHQFTIATPEEMEQLIARMPEMLEKLGFEHFMQERCGDGVNYTFSERNKLGKLVGYGLRIWTKQPTDIDTVFRYVSESDGCQRVFICPADDTIAPTYVYQVFPSDPTDELRELVKAFHAEFDDEYGMLNIEFMTPDELVELLTPKDE